jgi:hypothetical protein
MNSIKYRKILIIILTILTTLSASSCSQLEKALEPKKPDNEPFWVNKYPWFMPYQEICADLNDTVTTATAVDNHDGTIIYTAKTKLRTEPSPLCIAGHGVDTEIVHYKKCLQGQVYRAAEDDCKGTGDNTNYYGAQKFQYCATSGEFDCIITNTNHTSSIPDPATSPAYANCYNDGFAGKKWSLPNAMNKHGENGIINAVYINRPDEIPLESEAYWGFYSHYYGFPLQAWANAYRIQLNSVQILDALRTENHYVLCASYYK